MRLAKNTISGAVLAGAAILAVSGTDASAAPSNVGPPIGAILDLNGQPITNSQQSYSVNFTATVSNTAITFAFRQDPSFESFSNASVVDTLAPSTNLLLNGNFALGTVGTSNVTDWSYANIYGATFGGVLATGCGFGGSNCWSDGAVQAYDAISQTIATTIGHTYTISFNLDGGSTGTYSDLSTNGDITGTGGNGIDVLAYAQAGLPTLGVPEPLTFSLFGAGLGGIVALRRRRKAKV